MNTSRSEGEEDRSNTQEFVGVRRLLMLGLLESAKNAEHTRKEIDYHWPHLPPDGCRCQCLE